MRFDRDLENELRKLGEDVAPGRSLREAIQAELAKRPAPQIQPVSLWRTMMRSPVMKMTPAAVVIVTVALCIVFWQSPSTPAYAIGQTIEAIRNVRYIHVIDRSGVGGVIRGERWIEIDEDGRQVRYRQDRPPHVLVVTDGKATARFHHDTKTILLYDCDEMPYHWIGPLRETFNNLLEEGLIIQENAVRRGRHVHKVWWPMMRRICYVDPRTKLPIEIGRTYLSYEEPTARTFDIDISQYAHEYGVTDRRSGADGAAKAGGGASKRDDLLYADMKFILDANVSVETVNGDNIIPLYQTEPGAYAGEVDLMVTCERNIGIQVHVTMTGTVPAHSSCWIFGGRPSVPRGVATVGIRLNSVPRLASHVGHVATLTVQVMPLPEPMSDVDACDTLAFALYDARRYEEALAIFEKMERASNAEEDQRGIALVWQGHVLDLLGRREEAITEYQKAAKLGVESVRGHDHYGLPYEFTRYAEERIETPFVRPENEDPY